MFVRRDFLGQYHLSQGELPIMHGGYYNKESVLMYCRKRGLSKKESFLDSPRKWSLNYSKPDICLSFGYFTSYLNCTFFVSLGDGVSSHISLPVSLL
jgi:hypothetical protein